MYKVTFYLYNRFQSQLFDTLEEAVRFSIYKVPFQGTNEIYKV